LARLGARSETKEYLRVEMAFLIVGSAKIERWASIPGEDR